MNRAKAKSQRHTDEQPHHLAIEEPKRPTLLRGRLILLCVLILSVGGAIVGLSLSVPKKRQPDALTTTPPVLGPAATDVTSGIPNPSPWQYDPVTDRHWVATEGHNHRHKGRPPANAGAATAGTTFTPPIPSTARPSSGVPDIANPQPWQYDPVTNKHWDPRVGHLHWHAGQAPPPDQRQPTPPKAIPPPAPGNP